MKLPQFCIKRPVFTTVMSLIIVVVGVISYTRLPLRGYPNVSAPKLSVITTYPGASASIIETQITTPIENQLTGINGLQSIRSKTREGRSVVQLRFDLGIDTNTVADQVRNLVGGRFLKKLPQGADAPVVQNWAADDTEQTQFISLADPSMSAMDLIDYATRNIVPAFQQVSGVASVELYDDAQYAMRIDLNPAKMAEKKVSVNDVTDILKQQNINLPSGQIKTPSRYYSVLTQGQLQTPKQFQNLIIRDQTGYMVRFGDVANIKVGPENADSLSRVNGKSSIGMGVYADSTANPIVVAQQIDHAIKKLQKNMPEGMHLSVQYDNTDFLKVSVHDVYRDLAFALFLVVVVVLLFLGSWRSTFIPIVTIPICLIGVFTFVYVLGYSVNIFTLLALVLAIGLVVDDSIVVLENNFRHIEEGKTPHNAALIGSKEIAFAVVAMTITLASVYAPIGFARGMTGIVFREFAFTLAIAVIISGFVALTLSPMMCARFLQPVQKMSGYGQALEKIFQRIIKFYRQLLQGFLRRRLWVTGILVVIAALGFFIFQSLPSELSPSEDMGTFNIIVNAPANASLRYTSAAVKKIEKMVLKIPEVTTEATHLQPDRGMIWVTLKPWSQRSRSAQQIIAQVNHQLKNISQVQASAFSPSFIGGGGKNGDSVQLVVMTNDTFPRLYNMTEKMLDAINKYPGLTNASQDLQINSKEFVVHVNHAMAAALQVDPSDVMTAVQTMLGGATVSKFNWDNHDYDVILQLPDKDLKNPQIIDQLYVRNTAGKMIPLSSLASISQIVAPASLPHQDRLRADTITAQVTPGYSMGEGVKFLRKTAKQLLPSTASFKFRGVAQRMLESRNTMIGSFALALIFIYLVLSAQFESFIDPFIIMLTVPLSMVGALFTLKVTGNSLSIYTNIGFVTLIGLIAKHGILITEFANQLRAQGKGLYEAIEEAAAMRLRPILMTTAAMVIGALPLALSGGAGAIGRQHIGWVIVGGMFFGTFFSLVVVPVAYSFFGQFRKIKLKKD